MEKTIFDFHGDQMGVIMNSMLGIKNEPIDSEIKAIKEEMTTCEVADSVKAWKCQTEEQCDDCFLVDHLKECNGCEFYDHPITCEMSENCKCDDCKKETRVMNSGLIK